ncbi:hypothetical protein CA13_24310 [Planctomycetes bacterium CA13]|uniref:Uncharacterized protein n=1 Tax=Novipirellula herctigrandis TaxID=2527986 RepID=A0A5C5Z0Z3_9BACT|nr:hypothetical protein CA13_24310 [Planctomycetes bacterium CA13]
MCSYKAFEGFNFGERLNAETPILVQPTGRMWRAGGLSQTAPIRPNEKSFSLRDKLVLTPSLKRDYFQIKPEDSTAAIAGSDQSNTVFWQCLEVL